MKSIIAHTRSTLMAGALAIGIAAFAAPAQADLMFDLDVDGCTGGCGVSGTVFGTVTLSVVDVDTIHVDVELTPEFTTMFVNTGAGYSLTWVGLTGETVSALTDGFSFLGMGTYNTGGNFGTFNYAIDCVVGGVACPKMGGGNATTSTLEFDVTHAPSLALTDFAATNPQGFYFTVDLIGPTGRTGVVAADSSTSTDCIPGSPECSPDTNVPEPSTLALLGATLLSGVALRRRRERPTA